MKDLKHARQQVYKIMRSMGKEPATFDDSVLRPRSGRRLSCEQLLALALLLLIFVMVCASATWMFLDWKQRNETQILIELPTAKPKPTPTPSTLKISLTIFDETTGEPINASVWLTTIKNQGSTNRIVRNSVSSVDFNLPDIEVDEIYLKLSADGYLLWFEKIPPQAFDHGVWIVEALLKKIPK